MKKLSIYLVLFVALFSPVHTQGAYKVPPKEVVDILDASPTPSMVISPCGDLMLQMEYDPMSSIAHMAQPMVQLAGLRIIPRTNGRQRTLYYTGLVIQHLADGSTRSINLPKDARLGRSKWSYDSKWLAFTLYTKKGIELWTVDVEKATAKAVTQPCVNATLGSAFQWMPDSKHVLVRMIPKSRGSAPEAPTIPDGPKIQETVGRFAKVRTYQGLLGDSHDESLFDHYTTSQLVLIDVKTGKHRKIGVPDIYHYISSAPSGELLLVNRIKRPYSHGVPYPYFPRSVEIWNMKGEVVHVLADLPLADEMPVRGVPTGPRSVDWRPLQPATLVWVEALDEGDPKKKVPYRDKLMTVASPFEAKPREICKIQHRYQGIDWLPTDGQGMIAEYDWERRWRTTKLVDFDDSTVEPKTIFDLSIHDRYNAPGYLIHRTMLTGRQVLLQDGDWIYLSGRGATPQGDRPFLDRMNVKTLKKERLFLSGETSFESFIAFVGNDHSHIVTRYESKTEPRNYFVRNLPNGESRALTHFENPAPQLTGLRKQLITYKRKDGINLSGTLYLPPSYQIGKRLPLVIWAYPMEYSDPGTAGQVSGSPNRFTLPRGASRLFFLTQGYAVLDNAQMPVIGDPESVNNTFIEQIVAGARAAIEHLDSMGIIDPGRVGIGGHSYGAFMTANLLAHCDLFAAGIAISGAYNRTLTPFGFQSERRTLWEAPEVYIDISPFMHADKINEPILLIHGEMDNNPGTFPIQSERLYHALKGHGATARYVVLQYEGHGCSARESVLHVLAEMFEWFDKYVKDRK